MSILKTVCGVALVALPFMCGFGSLDGDAAQNKIQSVVANPGKSACYTISASSTQDVLIGNSIGVRVSAVDTLANMNQMPYSRAFNGNGVYFPVSGGYETIPTGSDVTYIRFQNLNSSSILLCVELSGKP